MSETEMARKITELERKLVEERQETERERLKVINYANLVAIKEKSIAGLKEKLAASEQDLIDYRNEAMKIHFERNKRLHKLEAVITQVRIAILNGTNIPPEARDFIVSTMKPSDDGKDGRETQVAARREKKVPETRKGDEAERGDATRPLIPPAPETPEGEGVGHGPLPSGAMGPGEYVLSKCCGAQIEIHAFSSHCKDCGKAVSPDDGTVYAREPAPETPEGKTDRKSEIRARIASGEMTTGVEEDFTWLLSELERAQAKLAAKESVIASFERWRVKIIARNEEKKKRISELEAKLNEQGKCGDACSIVKDLKAKLAAAEKCDAEWVTILNNDRERIAELEAENFKQEGMLHSRWEIVQRQEADIKRLMGNEQILHATMKKDVQRYKDAEAEIERLTAIICRVCKLSKDNCGDCPYHIKPSGDGKGTATAEGTARNQPVPDARPPETPEGETVRLSLGSEVLYEGPESGINPNLLKIFKEMRPSDGEKNCGTCGRNPKSEPCPEYGKYRVNNDACWKPSGDGKDGRETQVAARREKKVPETRKGDEAAQGDATGPLIPPAPETPGGKSCSDCRWEDECRNYKSEEPRASCGPAYKHFTPKLTPAPEASEGKAIWLEYGTCCKQCVCYSTTPRGIEPCVSCMAARSKFKSIKDDCQLHRPFDTCVGVEGRHGGFGHCSPGKYPFCPNRARVPDPEPPEGEHKNCPECGWCPICGDTNCNTRK